MRILLIGDGPVPHPFMNYRADALAGYLARRGTDEVRIVCPSNQDGGAAVHHGEGCISIRYTGRFRTVETTADAARRIGDAFRLYRAARQELRNTSFDVVRAVGLVPTVVAILAVWSRRVCVVANLSDFYDELYESGGLPFKHLVRSVMAAVQRLCARADVILVDSPTQRDRWAAAGVAKSRCIVLPHGLPRSADLIQPASDGPGEDSYSDVRRRWSIGPDERIVVYVGDIGHMDGVDRLIAAAGIARQAGVPVTVLLIGSGTRRYMQFIEECTKTWGMDDHLVSIERVPNRHLSTVLAQSDACAAPFRITRTTESAIQNKVMEYLTVDVPIIATRTAPLEWAFRDTITLVNPEDLQGLAQVLLSALSKDPRDESDVMARERTRAQFGWARILDCERSIMEEAVGGRTDWTGWDFAITV